MIRLKPCPRSARSRPSLSSPPSISTASPSAPGSAATAAFTRLAAATPSTPTAPTARSAAQSSRSGACSGATPGAHTASTRFLPNNRGNKPHDPTSQCFAQRFASSLSITTGLQQAPPGGEGRDWTGPCGHEHPPHLHRGFMHGPQPMARRVHDLRPGYLPHRCLPRRRNLLAHPRDRVLRAHPTLRRSGCRLQRTRQQHHPVQSRRFQSVRRLLLSPF